MNHSKEKPDQVVYARVWQIPVRVAHWVMFFSIITLGITGYLIGNPGFSEPTEASKVYTFGNIRFIHFLAGYILAASFLLRLYWGLVGNHFSRWLTMLPFTKNRFEGIFRESRALLWPKGKLRVYTGHSPLANVGYLVLYLGLLTSIVTGFTLYAQSNYTPFWRKIAAGGLSLFGNNLNNIHLVHHLLLWFFILFFMVHLYLVIYTVTVSRTTQVDTMISGKKFVFREELEEAD